MPQEKLIKNELTEGFDRYDDVVYESRPSKITQTKALQNAFHITCLNGLQLVIQFWSDYVIRCCYIPVGQQMEQHSYVIDQTKLEKASIHFDESETLTHQVLETERLSIYIDRSDLTLKIFDRTTNELIHEDAAPFIQKSTILKGNQSAKITKRAQEGESFWGFGDKSCSQNLRGNCLENWNTDAFGFGHDSDPLYRSIPFYYGIHEGRAYGIFLHNTHRSTFDFDQNHDGEVTIQAHGGQIDYFFIYGPKMSFVSQRYLALTGVPEMPPIWAFGFHQCRWSYYPESRVRELAQTFREKEIPCDAIYLDIDYMDGYRCFTWNKEHFPDPTNMIADLEKQGFQTIVMIDPGIKLDSDYWVYQSGLENNVFCKRTNGDLMIGPVWPQECVFPDFTDPKVRDWWVELHRELYVENGVSGFWNDMNEPAVFKVNSMTFPDEVLHHYDGQLADHTKAHNIYGMQMSRASYEALKQLRPDKRPFVLTRTSFSGGQRFASIWTGDNLSTWEHLRIANFQCQRASISGFSFVGTDIGGFAGEPDGELFVRWLQLGIFHPLYRVHSMGNHSGGAEEVDEEAVKAQEALNRLDQEPWSFGEPYTKLSRAAIELRYKLLGYLYTAFHQYIKNGLPVLKPLAFEAQQDQKAIKRENEFIFGDHMLVNPVVEPGVKQQYTYLPAGKWYQYWTHETFDGAQMIKTRTPMDEIPMFVRAGAVIPIYPIQQFIGEKKVDNIDLQVYFGEKPTNSYLYQDAGEGMDYLSGAFKLRTFVTKKQGNAGFALHQEIAGSYSANQSFSVTIIGLPKMKCEVYVDGNLVPFVATNDKLTVQVQQDFKTMECRF